MAENEFPNLVIMEESERFGHSFSHQKGEPSAGIACRKCCKPLWMICKEEQEQRAKKKGRFRCGEGCKINDNFTE